MTTTTLWVTEIFQSIQGETSFTGLPTTFIRLASCNLRCAWCDTTYSFSRGEELLLSTIIEKIESYQQPYVCITGGEPLLQKNVIPLMNSLTKKGFILSLETGGSLDISSVPAKVSIILDIKCPHSNMSHKNLLENISHLKPKDEVKFVIANREDYDFAKKFCQRYALERKVGCVLFSPVFKTLEARTLVDWILKDHLNVRLNLQVHKWVWHPETQGV